MASNRDKRLFPRRLTVPVPVLLSHEGEHGSGFPGEVLDYSPAGLTIQATQSVAVDAVLRIHCVHPGRDAPPLEIRVVHCSSQQGGWQLGCRFDPPRHWDDLWMFGN